MTGRMGNLILGFGFGAFCLVWAFLGVMAFIRGEDVTPLLIKELLCLILANQYWKEAKD